MRKFVEEISRHLTEKIIPFWEGLKDEEQGGYYGYMGYIQSYLIDPREGSEWFWAVDAKGNPLEKPIVEPWKCPYHNGRMCMEVLRRFG